MLSSQLLVSLCETDAEEWKFCIRNHNGSLSRQLSDFYLGGYTLSCGEPKEDAVYLVVDALLDGMIPDIIFSHKAETFESTMFGYEIDDMPKSLIA